MTRTRKIRAMLSREVTKVVSELTGLLNAAKHFNLTHEEKLFLKDVETRFIMTRPKLLALPGKLSRQIAAEPTVSGVEQILHREIKPLLDDLGVPPPKPVIH